MPGSERAARTRRATAIAASAYLAFVALQIVLLLRRNGGELTYALDDAYIHLAVARNLALHGVIGVEPGVWASASSSPLWTLILAPFAFLPPRAFELVPLALNLVAGVLTSWCLAQEVVDIEDRRARDVAALCVPFVSTLAGLALMGMEATLFALLALVFVRETTGARRMPMLVALACALSLTRPEGFVLVCVAAAATFARDRRGAALTVVAATAALCAFGAVNMRHGDAFLPNSVTARTWWDPGRPGESGLAHLLRLAAHHVGEWLPLTDDGAVAWLALLAIIGAILCALRDDLDADMRTRVVIVIGAVTAHAFLASTTAPLGRYQSYLLVLLVALLPHVRPRPLPRAWTMGLVLLSALALYRPLRRQLLSARAAHEIWLQQRTIARFLSEAEPTAGIVANDIGNLAFHRPGPLIDICGLGSSEIERARRTGKLTMSSVQALVERKHAGIVVVYEDWLGGEQPCATPLPPWHRIATWTIPGPRFVVGSRTVTFGAFPGHELAVEQALRRYEVQLPKEVDVQYLR